MRSSQLRSFASVPARHFLVRFTGTPKRRRDTPRTDSPPPRVLCRGIRASSPRRPSAPPPMSPATTRDECDRRFWGDLGVSPPFARTRTHTHAHAHAHARARAHTHTHARARARAHTHTVTQPRTRVVGLPSGVSGTSSANTRGRGCQAHPL